jgi:hypothetical protein
MKAAPHGVAAAADRRVIVHRAARGSSPRKLRGAVWRGHDASAPAVSNNERVAASSQTTITLAWSAAADNVGVAGYNLYLNGSKAGSTQQTSYV